MAGIALLTSVAVYVGWRAHWFLTDDAFIAFRYASNSVLGRGYVWNPAPFAPVEGYTSFLWTFVLRQIWALTGIEPPIAANWLALALGYVTLALGARMLLRMALPPRVARYRVAWLALVLVATVTNRTFLTWLSSGLETSLFNCTLTYWVFAVTSPRGGARSFQIASASALSALTRPDGLLFAAAALPLIADELAQLRSARLRVLACTPLLLIPAHLAFRVCTYGEWVPNTYYAKLVKSWPEAGARYLLSFALEYAVWYWALCALAFLVVTSVRGARARREGARTGHQAVRHALYARLSISVAVGALLCHAGYYVAVIGGDHFEYRVFSHLPLLLALALVWLLAELIEQPRTIAIVFVMYIGLALPIPWMQWHRSHALNDHDFHHRLRIKLADDFPAPLRAPVRLWDETQDWLIHHAIGSRQIEHKLFCERMLRSAPTRAVGEKISWERRPVVAAEAVGVLGYMLPNVAVIDLHGLSDRVVARTPPPQNALRKMAHERLPPPGYERCFRPNVVISKRHVREELRKRPLTDARIKKCDALERWVKPTT